MSRPQRHRSGRWRIGAACAALLTLSALPASAEPVPVPVVVFDFELIDTSLEGELNGPRADETARLAALAEALRAAYRADPDHALIEVAQDTRPQDCRGCVETMAAHLGAERAVTGTVQKVSNLILNINVVVRDIGRPDPVVHSADIRSNTDESWARGLSWLARNRLGLRSAP